MSELTGYGDENEEIVPPEAPDEGDLGVVPGQVIVRLNRADGDTGIASSETAFVSSLPVFGDTMGAAGIQSRTGNPELDTALDSIDATALWRVQRAASESLAAVDESLAELSDLIVVEFDAAHSTGEAVERLSRASLVAEVTPSGGFSIAFIPNDPGFPGQWGLADVRCPDAWNTTQGDPSVVVAVLDTGSDLVHADLATQYASEGTNVLAADQTAQDNHGHGTHVAGIIAARGDNAVDVAGVAWKTRIVPVKVLNGAGRVVGASVAQGVAWAATRCSIINLSLQGAVDDATLRAAMDGARRLGVLVVAAMGNFGWDETRPSFPAAYSRTHDNVIAVGAVDRQHRRSVWSGTQSSNTGSWIHLAAPGTNIDSTAVGARVRRMSGTSQACPHVAGAAALLRAVAPELTAQQLRTVLTSTSQPLRDDPSDPVPNSAYGYGLLDIAAAVAAATATEGEAGGVATAGGAVGGGAPVVEAWTIPDPPRPAGAAKLCITSEETSY